MSRFPRGRLTLCKIMGVVASIAVSCAWPPFLLPTVFVLFGLFLPRSILLTIVAWNLACLVMLYVHAYAFAPAIFAAYTARFGDVQASDGRFAWVAITFAFVLIPLPPTFVCVRLNDALARRPSDWRRIVASSVAWELVLLPVLVCSRIFSLDYKIKQLGWAIIGPPDNLYSFTNLVLPWLLSWLICTVPVGVAALWLHEKTGGRNLRNIWHAYVCIDS
ncbi:hypothetical protein SAMN05444166_6243 [Singulisphaera sp. GP187]|uniref:hypothetical protein n=1 Tax=Singulisphaera sp. GP187 TaxID=1882752 RepID=UPI00092A3862|nr:hypothetical protein [Singulisphaera sp. GP187]SIO60034.1 hypothetical protein SAMN05444166_6243 [Singulisphaera sp. GP187]